MTSMAAKSKRRENSNEKSLKFSLRTPHTIAHMSNDILGDKTTQAVSNANKHKESYHGLFFVFWTDYQYVRFTDKFHFASHQFTWIHCEFAFNRISKAEGLFESWQKVGLSLFFVPFPKEKDLSVEVIVKKSLHKDSGLRWCIITLLHKDTT